MNPSIAPQYAIASYRATSLLMVFVIITIILLYDAYVPKSISIVGDGRVSEVICARIAAYATAQRVATSSLSTLYAEIKKIARGIGYLTVSYDRPGYATLFLEGMNPCALVNETIILTTKGVLIPLEEFSTEIINRLPHIVVAEPCFAERSRVLCSAWIAKLPPAILEKFSITWYARGHIELIARDTTMCGLIFITWCYTDFSPEMVMVMERVTQRNKRIDLRVPHYAIVSPILRGNL